MSDTTKFGLFAAFIIIFTIIIMLQIGFLLDATTCTKTAQKLNYKYEYSIWTGCVLDDGKHKFLLEQLRKVD